MSYIYPFDPTTVGRSGRLIATVLRYFNYHFDTWAAMHIHIITRYVQKFSCEISHHIITGGGSMCKVLKSRCYSFLTTFNLCSIHWLHQHHGFIREEQWNTVSRWWLYRIARSNVLSLSPQISGKSLLFLLQHQGGSGIASIQWIPGYLLPTGLGIEARSSVRRVTIGQSKASRDRSCRDAFVERKKNLGILRHQASTSNCVKVLLPTFKSNTAISVHHIAP